MAATNATRTTDARHDLLGAFDLNRLGSLYLVARTLVEGIYQGRHATPDRGGSTEFFDYRMYSTGETLARVDWKVFGRTDRLYVRRFQHFGNLTLQLIVDGSSSMDFAQPDTHGSGHVTKWQYASQIAAALAYLAIRQSEHVALGIAGDQLVHSIPPGGTWRHLYELLHTLERFEPTGTTMLDTSIHEAQQLLPRRRLVMIISDFLCELHSVINAVRRLRHHGNDVACIQVLTDVELDPAELDADTFIDPEHEQDRVRADIELVRGHYVELIQEHRDTLRTQLASCGTDYHFARTSDHPLTVLRRLLARRVSR